VRSLHQAHCLGHHKTDFIWLDDTSLRGGCVPCHDAHHVGSNLNSDKNLCSDTQLEQLLKFTGVWKHTSSVSHHSCPVELSAGAELFIMTHEKSVKPRWRKPVINLKTMTKGVLKNNVTNFTKGQLCAALGFLLLPGTTQVL